MMQEMLVVNLLGNAGIYYRGEDITTRLSSKSVAIIMYLVENYNKKITREKISDLLWAEKYENSGYNLRYNLWNIKKVIPGDEEGRSLILANKEYCYINPEYRFNSDVIRIKKLEEKPLSSMSLEELREMKSAFRGDFLEQLHIKDAEELYEWILSNRVRYQKLHASCLNQIYLNLKDTHMHEEKVEILEEILLHNPYDEESHYNLMTEYIKLGERHMAISQYKKCDQILRAELNIGAKKKLKELYLKLLDDRTEISEHRENLREMHINSYCNRNIEYLALGQLMESLLSLDREKGLRAVSDSELRVFSSVVSTGDSDLEHAAQVKDIRLFIAVRDVMKSLMEKMTIRIYLHNKEKLDPRSRNFFDYIMGTDSEIKNAIELVK